MKKNNPIELFRGRCSGEVIELPIDERDHWRRQWRRAYGGPHKASFEEGDLAGYDWHLFSFKVHPSVDGAAAVAALRARSVSSSLLAIPSYQDCYEKLPGFRISAGLTHEPPALEGVRLDYLLFPESLAWTYACTHEDGYCGPYFATLKTQ